MGEVRAGVSATALHMPSQNGTGEPLQVGERDSGHLGGIVECRRKHTTPVRQRLHVSHAPDTRSAKRGARTPQNAVCSPRREKRRIPYLEKSTLGACAAPGVSSSKYGRG